MKFAVFTLFLVLLYVGYLEIRSPDIPPTIQLKYQACEKSCQVIDSSQVNIKLQNEGGHVMGVRECTNFCMRQGDNAWASCTLGVLKDKGLVRCRQYEKCIEKHLPQIPEET